MFFRDSFDSEIMGIDSYKLFIDTESVDSFTLADQIRSLPKPNFVCCVTPLTYSINQILCSNGFSLVASKVTYRFSPDSLGSEVHLRNQCIRFADIIPAPAMSDLVTLVHTVANQGRLAKDKLIPIKTAHLMYEKWVENSIFASYADEVIFTLKDGKPRGFITLKRTGNGISIDLIVVDPMFQNKGIGKDLVAAACQYAIEVDAEWIEVETEAENVSANRLYQKAGFLLRGFQLVYHLHNK